MAISAAPKLHLADYSVFVHVESAARALKEAGLAFDARGEILERAAMLGRAAAARVADPATSADLYATEYCATIAAELRCMGAR